MMDDREAAALAAGMQAQGVPEHLRDGFIRYFVHGVPTGSGIRRVLENGPMFEVVAGLDDESLRGLRSIVKFIYNFAPAKSHGSPEAVAAWIEAHREPR